MKLTLLIVVFILLNFKILFQNQMHITHSNWKLMINPVYQILIICDMEFSDTKPSSVVMLIVISLTILTW